MKHSRPYLMVPKNGHFRGHNWRIQSSEIGGILEHFFEPSAILLVMSVIVIVIAVLIVIWEALRGTL